MSTFSIDIARAAKRMNLRLEQLCRAIALELYRSVIVGTPVDTGRARGNWQTTIGAPVELEIERLDKPGQAAVAELSAEIAKFKPGEIIYMSNNLPYILSLEEGSSTQAPAGMVRTNFARIQAILRAKAAA